MLLAVLALMTVARAQQAPTRVRTNADLLAFLLGVQRAPLCSTTNPSVGTSNVRILGNDPAAIQVTVINLSANNCFFAWDAQVSTTRGIELLSGGGGASENVRDDTVLPTFEHWAVCAGSSSSLMVLRCDLTG